MKQSFDLNPFFEKINLPKDSSHKGQNGKLMIIGGSDLFHAASRWSLDVASHFVDMVFYSSTPENNQLIKEAKQNFWNGIVVEKKDLENYVFEADVVLIGPGMTRTPDTTQMVNDLIKKYPDKKMVIDAGALQMVDPSLLNKNHLITPHQHELKMVLEKIETTSSLLELKKTGVGILLKGKIDQVVFGDVELSIVGGNAGMTKGGTGDVLSGLVAGLYCNHDQLTSLVVGSYVNKRAGEVLYEIMGPYFNATDLCSAVPEVMWGELKSIVGEASR